LESIAEEYVPDDRVVGVLAIQLLQFSLSFSFSVYGTHHGYDHEDEDEDDPNCYTLIGRSWVTTKTKKTVVEDDAQTS
jgi:hypothetical protein